MQKKLCIDEDEPQQSTPKVELHKRKMMLCIGSDQRNIIHFESLNHI